MNLPEMLKIQNELLRLLLEIVCELGSQSHNFNGDLREMCLEARELVDRLTKCENQG